MVKEAQIVGCMAHVVKLPKTAIKDHKPAVSIQENENKDGTHPFG
jgi:hypothetical protein